MSAPSASSVRPVAPPSRHCIRDVKTQCRTRHLRTHGRCRVSPQYQSHPSGKTASELMSNIKDGKTCCSLPCIGSVDPDFVYLLRILPQVFHVSENMTLPILANKIPQVSTQPHVRNGGFAIPPLVDRKAFKENEAFSIKDFRTYRVEQL